MLILLSCYRNKVILTLILALFCACNGSNRPQTKSPVNQLSDREIEFSGLLPFNMPNGVTLSSLLKNATNSIVVYVDSSSCESCTISFALNIRGYEMELMQKQRDDVLFLYIFNTQDILTLQERLHEFGFRHYYFVDVEGTFLTNNRIPANKRYHTFLIRENKVQIVGNPATSQKVRSEYNKALKISK